MKQRKQSYDMKDFQPFYLPKASPFGLLIALAGFVISFALIWHIWWLVMAGFAGLIALVVARTSEEETEYLVTKEMVLADLKGRN